MNEEYNLKCMLCCVKINYYLFYKILVWILWLENFFRVNYFCYFDKCFRGIRRILFILIGYIIIFRGLVFRLLLF